MKRLSIVSLVLAIVGAGISGYLTYVHYNLDALVCAGGGCEIVQTSRYSEIMGIPVALMGLLMFLAVIALIVVRDRIEEYAYLANAGIMILLVSSLIYFGYLTYLEANVIHAWCQWCVATSIVAVILFLVEAFRMRDDFRDPDDIPEYA
ncbi:MAG TPA: vitamin K epoxide reductase family protein [Thermomicrobiales bacterium]|nr:vitamin K epoxide reductase family protein [Thermomicrobiales bacterium]